MMIMYFCRVCGFELWDVRVIPKLQCKCGLYVEHEERE